VVINQFEDRLGLHLGKAVGVIAKGYLGSDLFFVIVAFWLAHLMTTQVDTGARSYASAVWRRMSRLYPLHLVTIALMGSLALAALRLGETPRTDVFDPLGLLGNVLLVQSWGALPTVSWNFPSWMVSAEWFGLLVFPGLMWLAMKGWSRTLVALAAPVVLLAALFESAHARGVLFTDMTAQVGVLRILPDFLFGAGLYRLGLGQAFGPGAGAAMMAAALAWIALASQLRLDDPLIWPAFGPLVLGAAEVARGGRSILDSRPMTFLGEISFAMLLLYLPVDIVYYHLLHRLAGAPRGLQAWVAWAGVFPAIGIAALLAYYGVERPAAAVLDRLDPFWRRARGGAAAAAA
jgi:peptidoglycan/LPS O-acetylase OafA/YrhL